MGSILVTFQIQLFLRNYNCSVVLKMALYCVQLEEYMEIVKESVRCIGPSLLQVCLISLWYLNQYQVLHSLSIKINQQ